MRELASFLIFLIGLLLAFLFIYYILLYPIRLAEYKDIKGNDLILIKVLTWIGLFSGMTTWLIALLYVIYYEKNK